MKKELTRKDYIKSIISLPVTIPLSLILFITRGKEFTLEDSSLFIKKFITFFEKEIYEFLNCYDFPEIKVNSYNNGDNFGKCILPGMFHFDFDLGETITALDRTDESNIYITIYHGVIYRNSLTNNTLTKYIIIRTIMHELTHYKQFVENRFISNSDEFDKYINEPNEIESRNNSKKFVLKHMIKLIQFILSN